jgi:C-terminal processing protease CtpA/Prc
MSERDKYIKKAENVFNHIGILYDSKIVRCIGFAEDNEDYYYKTIDNNKITYNSMVGRFFSLKDIYPNYNYMDEMFDKYWNAPKTLKFEVEWIGVSEEEWEEYLKNRKENG